MQSREIVVPAVERQLPLTEAQKQLWLLAQLETQASVAYNVAYALALRGTLVPVALHAALCAVLERHAVLRARVDEGGETLSIVAGLEPAWLIQDVCGLSDEARRERLRAEAAREFDLGTAPLLRTTLFKTGADEHLLLLVSHHIVVDGGSMATILYELGELYSARCEGRAAALAPPPRYEAHVEQQEQVRHTPAWQAAEQYWLSRFRESTPALDLPADRPRPVVKTFNGALESLLVEPELTTQLEALSEAHGSTLFMTLFAAFSALVHRLTGLEDVVLGINISGRTGKASQGVVGYLTRLLPVRVAVSGAVPATEFIERVRDTLLEALERRDYTLGDLIRALNPPRLPGRSPLVDVVFNFDRASERFHFTGLEASLVPVPLTAAKYDVDFNVIETRHGLRCDAEYNTDQFDPATIRRLLHLWRNLLRGLVERPQAPLRELSWLGEDERRQVVVEWNRTRKEYPQATLVELLEGHARRTPDAVAVAYEGVELTYRELNRRANQLGRHLVSAGVGREVRVGVCLERGIDWVVAILGVWKAAGVYVPLDAAYPKERLAFMLTDAAVGVLVTEEAIQDELPPHGARTVCLDLDWQAIDSQSDDDLGLRADPSELAYVMYTSGSTGNPKGAMLEHRGMLNHLWAKVDDLGLTSRDVVAQNAPASFDISVWQLLAVLLVGGQVQIIGEDIARDGARLLGEAHRVGATVLETVPTLLGLMVEQQQERGEHRLDLRAMRWMISNAEGLPVGLCRQWRTLYPHVALLNAYGPTECSDDVTHLVVGELPPGLKYAPLGGRVSNMTLYVLDAGMQPVPVGVAGELYIGGIGVGRGYLARPELTAARFVPDPFGEQPGARLYRTGDHVRLLPDGACDFMGRLDHQIKLRGLRVELPEIEATLDRHPSVLHSAVIVREDDPGDKRLVGYVVGKPRVTVDPVSLRAYLKERLPEHMVPSALVVLPRMPLTANEKIDRKALPRPENMRPELLEAYRPARTRLEEAVAAIWCDVLHLERVGIDDNFFELGGHSLLATQVMSRVRKQLDVDLPLRRLFEGATVAALAHAVEEARAARDAAVSAPIRRAARDQAPPLSYAQQRMWFLQQYETDRSLYNMLAVLRITGNLQASVLERVLEEIVRRHEVLRTTFVEQDGVPVQLVNPPPAFTLPVVDLPAADQQQHLERHIAAQVRRPFDLAHGPVMRAELLRLAPAEHVLLLAMHHIVGDGWSMEVLWRELAALYDAFSRGQASPLPELALQYADYAVWEREWLKGEVLQRQIDYWRAQIADAPRTIELPTIGPRPPAPSHQGRAYTFDLAPEIAERLQAIGKAHGTTLFITLLAAFQALLGRYTGQSDIVVGSPIAGRSRAETEDMVGFFVNALVMRTDLSGRPSFSELLRRAREVALGAYANQELPFDKLVEELQPKRDMSRTPLFQVMFDLQSPTKLRVGPAGLTLIEEGFEFPMEKFDLSWRMVDGPQGLSGIIRYQTDLFDEATIAGMARHFTMLLRGMLNAPDKPVADLELLEAHEKQVLTQEWSDTRRAYKEGRCIHELFEDQAARTPDAVAVAHAGQELSYRELDRRAAAVAQALRAHGVGPEVRVGLCVARSLDMLAAMLGVLKAGGAYVPIDPEYPAERVAFILQDAGVPVLLTERSSRPSLPPHDARELFLEDLCHGAPAPAPPEAVSAAVVCARNAAYVIYTSGSTGRPKGVVIEHRSAVTLIEWVAETFSPHELGGMLASASICFDQSIFDLFAPLAHGGTVLLADNALELPWMPERERVTAMAVVPSVMQELLRMRALPDSLRTLNLGGEALPRPLVDEIFSTTRVERAYNSYGPTEGTVYSTQTLLLRDGPRDIHIGRPVGNTKVYVLDSELHPVPVGVAGELCLGGAGLARGYLDRPALTAERFVPNPFGRQGGERLYRTGDRVRWRASGELEYMGRLDQQVKIHGFRIELGEVEAALAAQNGVSEAAVVAMPVSGETQLVGYVVPAGGELSPLELRSALKAKLPHYMVPAAVVVLERLPMTSSGKIDRKALPAPASAGVVTSSGALAPRTEVERRLARIWADALGREQVGVDEDFFELGGHSLLATRVISRVRSELGAEIGLRALFEWPTVAGFAERVEQELAQGRTQGPPIVPVLHGGSAPLSYAQGRLLFIHRLQPDSVAYNAPLHLRLTGELDPERLAGCLSEIVRRHEVLRTTFPNRDGEALQHIHPPRPVDLPLVDLSSLSPEERDAVAAGLRRADALRPFDLAQGPLFRATLLRLGSTEHDLLLAMHHVVTDGWSGPILVQELLTLWDAAAEGRPSPLPELGVQYADYAIWQQRWLAKEILEKQVPYWRRQLRDVPVLDLPTDRPRPPTTSHRGAELRFSFPPELSAAISAWSRAEGVTNFMTLLAAFQWLLSRYAMQDDVAVGTVIANRNRKEVEGLIGFFVNTLVLRTDVGGAPTMRELVSRVREVTLGAYAHQDCPFEKLVEEINPQRDLRRSPLFQVRFTLDNQAPPFVQAADLRVEELYVQLPEVKFELTMALESATDGRLAGYLVYAADLFERRTVERLVAQYQRLVASALASPDVALTAIDLLGDEEREEAVSRWNATARAGLPGRCVHELFEECAARTPNAPALAYEGERLSYAELDARANQLARHLREMGVGPEVRVGVCLGRSLELIVALLGVLKAGGAYVPLDPTNPVDRLAFLMEDAQIPVLLTQERLRDHLPSQWIQTVCLDSEWASVARHSSAPVDAGAHDDDLAYVIYTSGSTGAPKAVGVEHRQLVNYVEAVSREMGCAPGWRHAYLSSVAADLGNTVLFASLCGGGELHVIAEERALDGRRLAAYFREAGIDCTKITPTHLSGLQPTADLMPARLLVLGGEASSWSWVAELQALRPGCRVMNHYGPTECTVGALVCRLEDVAEPASDNIPLGHPLANVTAYLLDGALRPLPPGMAGELFLGGAGVARGYLGRPELTAERFVPDPFSATPGARLYRTGDKARRLVDGRIEFLGRVDHQVKIRGFRVELGEIESVLRRHPEVGQAAVVLREDAGQKRLVAYVSQRHSEPADGEATLYDLPNGLTIAQHNREETDFLYQQIFEEGHYLQHGMTLPEDACVLDVGANIGMFTLFAGERVPRGRIFSFEPIDVLARTVERNARLCAADVKVFAVGLSDAEKTAEFVYYPGYTHQSGVRAYAASELEATFEIRNVTCRLRRLSDVIAEEGLEYIDFLKIDVQRSEMDVLRGIDDADWDKIAQAVVFVIRHDTKEHTEARAAEVIRVFERRGFTVAAHQDGEFKGGDWAIYARNPVTLARRPASAADGTARNKAVVSPELRAHLQEHLPEHMVPSVVLVLPQLPLLASGKVARRALPAPDLSGDGGRPFTPPRDELETLLCTVWGEVLGAAQVGIHDNFFELGGHSLLGTQVVARLETSLGVEVPLATIFTAPTVATFAQEVQSLRELGERKAAPRLVRLNRDAFVKPAGTQDPRPEVKR